MNTWVTEEQTKNLKLSFRVKDILASEKSIYQKCVIYDTFEYGRLMTLDDMVMFTEKDEFVYHEMIAHVPLSVHPNPENILVIGGGDGGTVREILKHKSVKSVVLVEIDKMVIDLSKKFMPFTASCLDDNRVEVLVEDGIKYIQNQNNRFDVIIIDSTDPVSFAEGLFHHDFYNNVKNALKEDGIMVAQTESPFLNSDLIEKVYDALKVSFENRYMYLAHIPTYPSGMWSFSFATKKYNPITDIVGHEQSFYKDLKYYSVDIHKSAFALPPFVKQIIKEQ